MIIGPSGSHERGGRAVIASNEGLTCRGHHLALTAHSVLEASYLNEGRGRGVEDDLEVRLRAAAGIEKYRHRFRGSIL